MLRLARSLESMKRLIMSEQAYQTICMFCGKRSEDCDCFWECPIHEVERRLCGCALCHSCGKTRELCTCLPCPECGQQRIDCECERCSSCKELIDDCECERCSSCGELTENCECERCSSCGELTENCECERCSDCGELISDCECERCPECGELTENCECTKLGFSGNEREVQGLLDQYSEEALTNQLGLDLERLRLSVLREQSIPSGQKINELNSRIQGIERSIQNMQLQGGREENIQKANNAIQILQNQIQQLSSAGSIFNWGKESSALRDRILNEVKSLGVDIGVFRDILLDQNSFLTPEDMAEKIEELEAYLAVEGNHSGGQYGIKGNASIESAYWAFHGRKNSDELVIGFSAGDVGDSYNKIWRALCSAFSAHKKTTQDEIAFAFIVDVDEDGDGDGDFWAISQMQSDVCSKTLRMQKFLKNYTAGETRILNIPNVDNFVRSLQHNGLTIEQFLEFCEDPGVKFILNNWADILMKKISYAARRYGVRVLLMEDAQTIGRRISFGNRGKVDEIYDSIHKRHGFEPTEDYSYVGYDKGLLQRRAMVFERLGMHREVDRILKTAISLGWRK